MSDNEEKVLTLKRSEIFPKFVWLGISPQVTHKILLLAYKNGKFLPRSKVEDDNSYKQIIPYIIFKYKEKFLLMQRKKSHSDARLANLYSFGIGGHIRKEDLKKGDSVIDWAMRELKEEVDYKGKLKMTVLGALNNESSPIHQVHLGIVILAEGNIPGIQTKDEHKNSKLVTLKGASKYRSKMELWSQMVLDFLGAK